jgi:tetratricopeptide (TPR) repeat protein
MMQRFSPHITVRIAAAVLLLAVCAFAQQNVTEMYQRALMLGDNNQNLAEAIKLYNLVISQAKDNRALAARAQYQIGMLYKRMGLKPEAQRAFKTVVSKYQDQTDLARRAQQRIPAAGANGKRTENAIVKRTGPSTEGWYLETFTFSAPTHLLPAVDPARHRL